MNPLRRAPASYSYWKRALGVLTSLLAVFQQRALEETSVAERHSMQG